MSVACWHLSFCFLALCSAMLTCLSMTKCKYFFTFHSRLKPYLFSKYITSQIVMMNSCSGLLQLHSSAFVLFYVASPFRDLFCHFAHLLWLRALLVKSSTADWLHAGHSCIQMSAHNGTWLSHWLTLSDSELLTLLRVCNFFYCPCLECEMPVPWLLSLWTL